MFGYGRVLGGLTLLVCAFVSTVSWAKEAELTTEQLREASAIAGSLWSPFCPGLTLTSCTSRKAAEWREDIRTWVAEDAMEDDIRRRLQARVPGFSIDTYPRSQLLSNSLIAGGFGAGLLLMGLIIVVRRQSRFTDPDEPVVETFLPNERRQLEAELDSIED